MIRTYSVRFVHKIRPMASDVHHTDATLLDSERTDIHALGLELRTRRALLSGERILAARLESDGSIVAFPARSIWHSIILTPKVAQ